MLILEKLDYLINYLLNENTELVINKIPANIIEKTIFFIQEVHL